MRDIGKNIRQLRIERNMTQEELAEALFVTRQTISNYETGRSRPDIDTLLLIAEVLKQDVNTILYGHPLSDDQRKRKSWLWISGLLSFALVIAYALLYPVCVEMKQLLQATPYFLLCMILRPATLFCLGWFAVHLLGMLLQLKPVYGKSIRIIRIIVVSLLGAVAVLPIPVLIWSVVAMVRSMTSASVSMSFPDIPVYSYVIYLIMYAQLRLPFLAAVMGGVCQLLGIPQDIKRRRKEAEGV